MPNIATTENLSGSSFRRTSLQDVLPAGKLDRQARRPNRSHIRVLIADDHRLIRAGLVGLLATCSEIDVIGEASDGDEAVQLAEQLEPDVVIMDVTMPRLNGIEAARRLHEKRPDIRIVGFSMHDSSEIAEAMLGAGASTFLTKGGSPAEIIDAVLSAV